MGRKAEVKSKRLRSSSTVSHRQDGGSDSDSAYELRKVLTARKTI